jgi:hypothetical protein
MAICYNGICIIESKRHETAAKGGEVLKIKNTLAKIIIGIAVRVFDFYIYIRPRTKTYLPAPSRTFAYSFIQRGNEPAGAGYTRSEGGAVGNAGTTPEPTPKGFPIGSHRWAYKLGTPDKTIGSDFVPRSRSRRALLYF